MKLYVVLFVCLFSLSLAAQQPAPPKAPAAPQAPSAPAAPPAKVSKHVAAEMLPSRSGPLRSRRICYPKS